MKAYYYHCEEKDKVETLVLMCEASYPKEVVEKKLDACSGILFADNDFYDILERIIPPMIQDLGCRITFLASHAEDEVSRLALDVACFYSMNCIYLCDLLMECILHQDKRLFEAIQKSFESVERESIQCAIAYLQCGMSVHQAASKLYVHRNTINYRLNKFMKQTHLDIRNYHDAMYFYLANKII